MKKVCILLISIVFIVSGLFIINTNKHQILNNKSHKAQLKQKYIVDYIDAAENCNSKVKFVYYIPPSLMNTKKDFPVIVLLPGFNGNGEYMLFDKIYETADKKGFGIIAPSFKTNLREFKAQKDYTYPEIWSGNALIKMLDKAREKGLRYSKLYMFGFSAGAQYSTRFSFMYPEKVVACASIANGERFYPTHNNNVNYYIAIGKYDKERNRVNAKVFAEICKKLNINYIYKEYEIDHNICREELIDILDFFKEVKEKVK